jgi:hypothetical protein
VKSHLWEGWHELDGRTTVSVKVANAVEKKGKALQGLNWSGSLWKLTFFVSRSPCGASPFSPFPAMAAPPLPEPALWRLWGFSSLR